MPPQPPPPIAAVAPDHQVDLAVSNALVQLVDLLVSKGVITRAEVTALLDTEAQKFASMGRPVAAAFTTLMSDSFRGDDGPAA